MEEKINENGNYWVLGGYFAQKAYLPVS